jgi:hypothetical protein
MKQRLANCPACGGPVEFQLSLSLVTICEFCHTVVARADKSVADHGKVADLVETDSPIHRGTTGKFDKKPFEVMGRVQYQHPAGGVWNEWYLQFPENRIGWLAEAQGLLYLMSKKRLPPEATLPDFESLSPGTSVTLSDRKDLVVAEKGIATARSAEGTIPWAFMPNAPHRFADLHGTGREFATIEYDSPIPELYAGRQVTLEELSLTDGDVQQSGYTSPNTRALQLNCPHCGGQLTLHAPDQTLRVCCPNCRSLLDCQQGKLEYLQTLSMQMKKLMIPLGATGVLLGTEYVVIGYVERYALYEGKKYPWSEYLLYNAGTGFRWLVCNKGHWSFVEPLPLTAVTRGPTAAAFHGQDFKIYDRGTAYVQCVLGEFYWRVTIEEQVEGEDYIAPPRMLSFERTTTETGDELNVSLGTYVESTVIATAFQLPDLRPAWGVGVIQPPPSYSDVWMMWLGFGLLLTFMNVFFSGVLSLPVSQFYFFLALAGVSVMPLWLLFWRYQFEVSRWQESDFSPYSTGE